MGLTFRQKSFLSRLLDLYREACQPLHYTEVAQSLGLGKSSAYDMLRLLEQRGLVTSEYVLPKESPSPGRSHVRFWPTAKAEETLSQSVAEIEVDGEEWEQLRAWMLGRLQGGKGAGHEGVLGEVMNMIPKAQSPLAVCAQIITVLLLSLKEAKYSLGPQSPLARVLQSPATKLGMSLAAGLAAGMVQMDVASRRTFDRLHDHMKRYEMSLEALNAEKLEALRRYTQEVVMALHRS